MDRQSPGEKQAHSNRTVATTTTPADITMAIVNPSSSTYTQVPPASHGIISTDRQGVQMIQQAIQRPQTIAAQFLHQMYAAQQQHLMLQTAALQQHQLGHHLQKLATIQQIALPASPVTALIGRNQNSNSSGAATTISQQVMLLGNRPTNCNQAQMYLCTQMLILTPAATVAALQTDLPAVTSCSSVSTSSQVQKQALHHLPGALGTARDLILKPSAQSHSLTPAASRTSVCSHKPNQLTDCSSEKGQNGATQLALGCQIITPALPALQTHTLVKQQLSSPPSHQVGHHQLILQQATGAAPNHRQLQPISLRVSPQDTNCNPPPLSSKRGTTPSTQSQTIYDSPAPSSYSATSLFSSSAQKSIPTATFQPQPPPLVAAPHRRTSFPQVQNHPPPLVLPRFPQNPTASLHSAQSVAIQSRQGVLAEKELPVSEALGQTPYQNLPPPQTVAVDLKLHPVSYSETPLSGQTFKVSRSSPEEIEDERPPSSQRHGTPPPSMGPPMQNGAVVDSSSSTSSRLMIRSPVAEELSQLATSNSNPPPPPPPPPPSPSLPPPTLPAAARGPSQPPSSPGSPNRAFTTHVLTHIIEGFVIQEGLEPFPVVSSSVLADQQASLPDSQEIQTSRDTAAGETVDVDRTDSSDSEMENDVAERGVSVLQCEYCGRKGYAHTFLRSKRFCSRACVRRFSVRCTKHITLLRPSHWGHRPAGKRGRPPRRVSAPSKEHFLRQVCRLFGTENNQEEQQEDEPPVPMTTRLRKQAERAREKEREMKQRITDSISISDGEEGDIGCPTQWNVEQVFSYISSLPGGRDVAEEFRSQEVDGQALLLLTEDHLVSTMNLKLGPALKLCAHINSLKEA